MNDTKRVEQLLKSLINYKASMTCTDVYRIHDINARVTISGQEHLVSGRYSITSLVKLKDCLSAKAEVHQGEVGDVVTVVHPNIPEAENLAMNLAKHHGAFLLNYLKDHGVDELFLQTLLQKILDPFLLHEAKHCKWDPNTCSLLMPDKLEEEEESEKFGEQSWFKDNVAQYKVQKQANSRQS